MWETCAVVSSGIGEREWHGEEGESGVGGGNSDSIPAVNDFWSLQAYYYRYIVTV